MPPEEAPAKSEAGLAPEARKGIQSMADAFRKAAATIPKEKPAKAESPEPDLETAPEGDTTEFKPAKKEAVVPDAPAVVSAPTQDAPEEPAKASDHPADSKHFARLRAKAEAAEKKVTELEGQLAKATEGTAKFDEISKKLAEAERKASDTENRLKEMDVYRKMYELETSEEFGQHFQRQIDEAIQDAKDASPDHQNDLETILRAPAGAWREARMRELIGQIEDEYGRHSLIVAYNKLKSAQRERAAELEKGRVEVNHKKLSEMRAAQIAEQAKRAEAVREQFWKTLETDLEPELKELEDGDNVKATLRDMVNGKISAEDYAKTLKNAARGVKLSKLVTAKDAEIAELKAQLAAFQGTSPKLGGTGGKTTTSKGSKSMGDIFREAAGLAPR